MNSRSGSTRRPVIGRNRRTRTNVAPADQRAATAIEKLRAELTRKVHPLCKSDALERRSEYTQRRGTEHPDTVHGKYIDG
jgi:hypothetical protein